MQLPVVGLMLEIQRHPCYVLGFARSRDVSDESYIHAGEEVAARCGVKFHRKTLLIRTTDVEQAASEPRSSRTEFDLVHWQHTHMLGANESETSDAALSEIGALPKWMRKYTLVVIELGKLGSKPSFALGRLCHGVAVQTGDHPNSLQISHRIQECRDEGLNVVGVWSSRSAA